MLNWIWPAKRRDESTIVIRTGRVLHWAAVVIAAAIIIVLAGEAIGESDGNSIAEMAIVSVVGVVFALPVLAIGRVLRYILSGE